MSVLAPIIIVFIVIVAGLALAGYFTLPDR